MAGQVLGPDETGQILLQPAGGQAASHRASLDGLGEFHLYQSPNANGPTARRLMRLAEERDLRQVPAAALHLDAAKKDIQISFSSEIIDTNTFDLEIDFPQRDKIVSGENGYHVCPEMVWSDDLDKFVPVGTE